MKKLNRKTNRHNSSVEIFSCHCECNCNTCSCGCSCSMRKADGDSLMRSNASIMSTSRYDSIYGGASSHVTMM